MRTTREVKTSMTGKASRGSITRRSLIRRAAAGAGAIGLLPLLQACTTSTPGVPPGSAPAATATSQAIQRGGDLRIALASPNVTMDPHFMSAFVDRIAADAVYDALLTYNQRGELQPGLAESWTASGDGKTITLMLRQGVKFHDGTDFDASAAKWNIDRMLNPEVKSPRRGDLAGVVRVEAVDGRTLRLQLEKPNAVVLPNLTGALGAYMVSPSAVESMGAAKFAENPVGTGPFKLERWVKGATLSFVRNDQFWKTGQPSVDRVTFQAIPEPTVMTLNLKSDHVDIVQDTNILDYSDLKNNKDVVIHEGFGGNDYVFLNTRRAPFDKVANRQAVQAAIDYEAIHKVAHFGLGQRGRGTPFGPSSAAWDPSLPELARDPARAKAKLAEAGNPSGFEFEAVYFVQGVFQQVIQIMQASLAEVGITMRPKQIEFAAFLAILNNKDQHDSVQMAMTGTRVNRLEPAGWVQGNLLTGASGNLSGWSNAKFDDLIKTAVVTADEQQRIDMYRRAARLIIEEAPMIYYIYPPRLQGTRARVQNYSIDGVGKLGYREVWLKKG